MYCKYSVALQFDSNYRFAAEITHGLPVEATSRQNSCNLGVFFVVKHLCGEDR